MNNTGMGHLFVKELTAKHRAVLKGLAHHMEPIVQVGSQGFSEGVMRQIGEALEKHELIKIKLPGNTDANTKRQEEAALQSILPEQIHLVSRIGRVMILYKEKEPTQAKLPLQRLAR